MSQGFDYFPSSTATSVPPFASPPREEFLTFPRPDSSASARQFPVLSSDPLSLAGDSSSSSSRFPPGNYPDVDPELFDIFHAASGFEAPSSLMDDSERYSAPSFGSSLFPSSSVQPTSGSLFPQNPTFPLVLQLQPTSHTATSSDTFPFAASHPPSAAAFATDHPLVRSSGPNSHSSSYSSLSNLDSSQANPNAPSSSNSSTISAQLEQTIRLELLAHPAIQSAIQSGQLNMRQFALLVQEIKNQARGTSKNVNLLESLQRFQQENHDVTGQTGDGEDQELGQDSGKGRKGKQKKSAKKEKTTEKGNKNRKRERAREQKSSDSESQSDSDGSSVSGSASQSDSDLSDSLSESERPEPSHSRRANRRAKQSGAALSSTPKSAHVNSPYYAASLSSSHPHSLPLDSSSPPIHPASAPGDEHDRLVKRLARKAELARASRRRKKAYVQDLEAKVKKLGAKIEELQQRAALQKQQNKSSKARKGNPIESLPGAPVREEKDRKDSQRAIRERLAELMQRQMSTSLSQSDQRELSELVQLFVQNSRERQGNMEFYFDRVEDCFTPGLQVKFAMWGLNQAPDFYSPASANSSAPSASNGSPPGLWATLMEKEIGLSPQQMRQLLEYRQLIQEQHMNYLRCQQKLREIRSECANHLNGLHAVVDSIQSVMEPAQLAKFYLWVENNEWCCSMLNHFFQQPGASNPGAALTGSQNGSQLSVKKEPK